jgi:hypothetical protein
LATADPPGDLRGLLGRVLSEWEDIPPDLRAAITKALSE